MKHKTIVQWQFYGDLVDDWVIPNHIKLHPIYVYYTVSTKKWPVDFLQ